MIGTLRAGRALAAAPLAMRVIALAAGLAAAWTAANWTYQAVRKPAELLFPISGRLAKTPAETWVSYAPLFRRHATATITPELLAALAQVEGAGDPVARTSWRWRLAWHPFEIYRPASSAVGMYQMTDPAFDDARRYCVRDHRVVQDGCWFRSLYTRILPGHAVELTAVLLDRGVARTLGPRAGRASALQKRDLAAVIHLCGAGRGAGFARDGFRVVPGQRCGGHDLGPYLARVRTLTRHFTRLAAGEVAGAASR